MEIKSYEKSWLPAFKGGVLIIFGLLAMLQITGTVKSLAIFFAMLVGMTGIVLIAYPMLLKKDKLKSWNIINGIINLAFAFLIIVKATSPKEVMLIILMAWIVFYALTEIIEAITLFSSGNAFGTLFLINALLSLLFGYGLYILLGDFIPQKMFNMGLIALVFGLINELSAYLLSVEKKS